MGIKQPQTTRLPARVLIVDDEPAFVDLVSDIVSSNQNCSLLTARDLAEAQRIIANNQVDILLADVHLPDGNGMTLLPNLRKRNPLAAAMVITGDSSVQQAINAMRAGVVDFLPKPFSVEQLRERLDQALIRQSGVMRKEIRLNRLRVAVKKLNKTRHTISKKVDLLCNDLVAAYGQLSRQLDAVRMQESFRRLIDQADDLEQLLCHSMDWILRQAGFCNVAIWLASEEKQFELGAYMKYTIPGEQEFTDTLRLGLLPMISRQGTVHLSGSEISEHLSPAETKLLAGQEIVGNNCTYLGESLAAMVMFRDEKCPFTDDDVAMLQAIGPIFAVTLATMVRQTQSEPGSEDSMDEGGGSLMDDEPRDNKNNKSDGDWWKRGEPPPF
ncbi:MAG TPA: response regulator [Tepidisphaeraceae bacterium]|nr:response regulator [Tepidisphaeraceae bacterium]